MPIRDKADYLVLLAIGCLSAVFAFHNYFLPDSAYITFAYAKNFAAGHGLIIAPGSHAFRYSNFLYTLLIGTGIWLGMTPEWASSCINATAYFAALMLAARLTWRLSSSYIASMATAIVLASHHNFSAHGSGGLEAMLVAALALAFYDRCLTYLEAPTQARAWHVALLAAVTLLVRLDSVWLLLPGYWCMGAQAMGQIRTDPKATIKHWLALDGVPVLAAVMLVAWCHHYYGRMLPVTMHIALPGDTGMLPVGVHYLIGWLATQAFIPYLILFLIWNHFLCYLRGRTNLLHYRYFLTLAGAGAMWLLYIAYIGGDTVEYGILVPVLPFFAILAFSTSALCFSHPIMKKLTLLAVFFLLGNVIQSFSIQLRVPAPGQSHTPPRIGDILSGKTPLHYDDLKNWAKQEKGITLP